jgi:hypothetical protein
MGAGSHRNGSTSDRIGSRAAARRPSDFPGCAERCRRPWATSRRRTAWRRRPTSPIVAARRSGVSRFPASARWRRRAGPTTVRDWKAARPPCDGGEAGKRADARGPRAKSRQPRSIPSVRCLTERQAILRVAAASGRRGSGCGPAGLVVDAALLHVSVPCKHPYHRLVDHHGRAQVHRSDTGGS